MDHRECRKRIGDLEDDLDYNIGRKEDLKKEVKNLQDKYDDIYEVYMKNTKAAMDLNVENAQLKAVNEKISKENSDLTRENKQLKDKIESLDTETSELQCLKSENRGLKETIGIMKSDQKKQEETIDCLKEEKCITVSHFEAEIQSLRSQIQNLLKCEECEQEFHNKTDIKTHIKTKHEVQKYKCDECGECFENFANLKEHIQANHCDPLFKCFKCEEEFHAHDNLKTHISNKHQSKGLVEQTLKKENYLKEQILKQKINLYDSLYQLKQKEEQQRQKCFCKGPFCRIAHSRYRWTNPMSDMLLNKFKLMDSNESKSKLECEKCELEVRNEDMLKIHTELHHATTMKCQCQECDEMLNDEESLKSHVEMCHKPSQFETTFFNPSLSRSKFSCQPCDEAFPDEDYLLSHMESKHNV